MKTFHLAAVLAALFSASAAGSSPAATPGAATLTPHAPIRPLGACMRAGTPRDWGVVDAKRVVVHTRDGRYYDIGLSNTCPEMARRPWLTVTEGWGRAPRDGRICGDIGETVVPHGGGYTHVRMPCQVNGIRRIDKATYEAVFRMTPVEGRHYLDTRPGYAAPEVAAR
jgi:hypothetical protein